MKGGAIVTGLGFVATLILSPVAVIAGTAVGWGVMEAVPPSPPEETAIELSLPQVDEAKATGVLEKSDVDPADENGEADDSDLVPIKKTSTRKRRRSTSSSTPSTSSSTSTRRSVSSSRASSTTTSAPPTKSPDSAPDLFEPDEPAIDEPAGDDELNIDDALDGFEIEMLDEEDPKKKKKKRNR